jgi:glucose-1-phosphate thymidylyltransferase
MKFVVPMAGVGTRLRPFTFSKPKGFFKVAGKRLIDHILDLFKSVALGPSNLLIITGSQERAVTNYIQEKYQSDFTISFQTQQPKGYHGNMPYFGGLGQAILLSEVWYKKTIQNFDSTDPKDYAIINLNDMVPLDGYQDFISLLCSNSTHSDVDGVIGIMKVPKSTISSYGIVTVDPNTGFIKKLVEKPKKSISNLAIAGVYGFTPKTMKALYTYLRKEVKKFEGVEGEAQLTPALHDLVTNGFKLAPMEFKKGILDFGKYSTLLEGNKILLKKQNTIHDITNAPQSSLNAPSFIGNNVSIQNCVIGPYCSIGDNCILNECIIRNSVIGDGANLERIITQNSIIGDNVIMDDIIKDNMIIGDQSNIRSPKNNNSNSL